MMGYLLQKSKKCNYYNLKKKHQYSLAVIPARGGSKRLKNKNILGTLIEKNKERIEFYRQADSRIVNENSNIEMTVEGFVKDLLLKSNLHS